MKDKIRVLVVDDVTETRDNTWDFILSRGYPNRREAANGEQALKKVEQLTPDIILMDVNMPIMDGITATEKSPLIILRQQ